MKAKYALVAILVITALLPVVLPQGQYNRQGVIRLVRFERITSDKYSDAVTGIWIEGNWFYIMYEISTIEWGQWYWWHQPFYVFKHLLIVAYNIDTNTYRTYRVPLYDDRVGYYHNYKYFLYHGQGIISVVDCDPTETLFLFKNGNYRLLFDIDLSSVLLYGRCDDFGVRGEVSFVPHGDYLYVIARDEYEPWERAIEGYGDYLTLARIPLNVNVVTPIEVTGITYEFSIGLRLNNIAVSGDRVFILSGVDNRVLVLDADTLEPIKQIVFSVQTPDFEEYQVGLYPHGSGFYYMISYSTRDIWSPAFSTSSGAYYIGSDVSYRTRSIVVKFDHDGNVIWAREYQIVSVRPKHATLIEHNNVLYLGLIVEYTTSECIPVLVAINPDNGDVLTASSLIKSPLARWANPSIRSFIVNEGVAFAFETDGSGSVAMAMLIPSSLVGTYIPSYYPMVLNVIDAYVDSWEEPAPGYSPHVFTLYPADTGVTQVIEDIQYLPYYNFVITRMLIVPGVGVIYEPQEIATPTTTPTTQIPGTPTRPGMQIPTLAPPVMPNIPPVYTSVPPGLSAPSIGTPEGLLMMGLPLVLFIWLSIKIRWTQALFITATVSCVMSLTLFQEPVLFAFALVLALAGLMLDRYL